MGEFGIGIKRSQQTFQEHELIKRGTQEKEQKLTLQSYITPQRNGEHKNSKQSQSQTANNSTPQWEELDNWELEMVVGGFDTYPPSACVGVPTPPCRDVPIPPTYYECKCRDVPTPPSRWWWWWPRWG